MAVKGTGIHLPTAGRDRKGAGFLAVHCGKAHLLYSADGGPHILRQVNGGNRADAVPAEGGQGGPQNHPVGSAFAGGRGHGAREVAGPVLYVHSGSSLF